MAAIRRTLCQLRTFSICLFLSVILMLFYLQSLSGRSIHSFFRLTLKFKRQSFNIQRWIDRGLVDVRALEFLGEVKRGARYIHTEVRSSEFAKIQNKVKFDEKFQNILYFDGLECFDNCFHFSNSTSCQRILPFDEEKNRSEIVPYRIVHTKVPIIQTFSMSNKLNCVQASGEKTKIIIIDEHSPPVALSAGVISHFNFNSSVFLYNAFWGLLLPKSNKGIPCYEWHNYWTLRLLWEINESLGFYPNALNASVTDEPKKQEFPKIGDVLRNWTCPTNQTFFECVETWTGSLSDYFQCNSNIEEIVMDWLKDLAELGYKESERATTINNYARNYSDDPTSSDFGVYVFFNPPEQYLIDTVDKKGLYDAKINQSKEMKSMCGKKYPLTVQSNKISKTIIKNVVLLIVFNHPHYGVVPFLENLYNTVFSHRVYCGANIKAFMETGYHRIVTFIELNTEHGFNNYLCMSHAMKMNYNVEGYLFLGDDVLLNTAQLGSLPLDKIWMVHFSVLRRSEPHNDWGNWMKSFGRPAFIKAWEELKYLSHSSKAFAIRFEEFKKKLEKNTGFSDGLQMSAADIYYIPSSYKENIIFYFDVFARHGVFLEIAVPTALRGLCLHKDFHFIPGAYLWTADSKRNYERFFDSKTLFIHPFKHRVELKSVNGTKFLCQKYFPTFFQ